MYIDHQSLPSASEAARGALVDLADELDAVGQAEPPDRPMPADGEVRYYKKHYSRRGGGDKMIDWHDCGHGRWTGGTYAPQAQTGIEKLEQTAVGTLQKCPSCTGGGVWKVTF